MLRAFEQDPGDALVGEWPIPGLDLPHLRELFCADPGDDMYESFPVRQQQWLLWSAPLGPRSSSTGMTTSSTPTRFSLTDVTRERWRRRPLLPRNVKMRTVRGFVQSAAVT
jgi:hypothetical protein